MSWLKKNYNPSNHTLFIPTNIEKYRGNPPVISRSKYELSFCHWCDNNSHVIWWSSENLAIPYYNSIKKRQANYYPDFIININNKTYVIELKPKKECSAPKYSKRKSLLLEQKKFIINQAKWGACKIYCAKFGWEFMVIINESLMK